MLGTSLIHLHHQTLGQSLAAVEGFQLALVFIQLVHLLQELHEVVLVVGQDAVLQGCCGLGGGGAHGCIVCCNVLSVSLLSMVKV